MKTIVKCLCLLVVFQIHLRSQDLKVIQDKNKFYFYEHPTLLHRSIPELKDKVYPFKYLCFLHDQNLSSLSYDIHNKIVDHLSEIFGSDEIRYFNTINLHFYLNKSDLEIDQIVISTNEKDNSFDKLDIIYRLIQEAYKVDFKSLLNLDINKCQHLRDHEWLMWPMPLIMNSKLYYIRL